MERSVEEKHGKNDNYDIEWRGRRRSESGGHQIGTSDEL